MHAVVQGERTLTDLDFSRLSSLASRHPSPALASLLANADVTPSRAIPAGVVTMYSRVELVDAQTGRRQLLTLCYPRDADAATGFISVLSPVGCSLLGLGAGDVATWHTPLGEACAATVAAIAYQPEAAGDYLA